METGCYRCGTPIDIREDECWQWSFEEKPSKKNVEAAIDNSIEGREFREWFREHYILCPDCHEDVTDVFEEGGGGE